MDQEKIGEYRKILENKKVELERRVDALVSDKTRKRGAISADFSDQAIDIENDEVIDEIEEVELKQLQQIDIAIKKMENGDYGFCHKCQKEISESRLKAMPYSTLCIKCAS